MVFSWFYQQTIYIDIMFYHAKDLQFNARVSPSYPPFASLSVQQLGGEKQEFSKELKAAQKRDKGMSELHSAEVKNAEAKHVDQSSNYQNVEL